MQVLIPLCLLCQQSFLSSKASIAHTTPGIWTGHLHWEGIASEQEDTQTWREQQYMLQERTFLWCDRRLRPIQAIKQAGSTSWLCVLLPPRSQNCSAHIWNLSQAQNGFRQRVETHCSFAQVCKAWWSLKECTTCPCIQSLSLASSHVLWTPRKVWHKRDVPQGWHPHATSSDCSPTAVLQTFPALPAPEQQLKILNVQELLSV